MKKAEINMVATNSIEALGLYKRIFELENVIKTSQKVGYNEVFFSIYGLRFHIMDENAQFNLISPAKGGVLSCWFDITVESIKETFEKAMENGCEVIFPVTFVDTHNVYNGMFKDKFGYVWLIHQEI
ncbi:hypothetical protein AN396_01545 [Candidatus Epulonipiscium fishelsonii]|uniref:Uncharacterized protein n=1 Tax=Candidatus Epulonipiscium fishelsonii TaxID=77094 RepID=A0ACC8X9Z0_9FIRM|nr:hypothetical protein AN396_01545 [Epulopiscium sp. SCG-B11WGA-EpuloA1]